MNEKYLLNYILIIKLFASRERLHFFGCWYIIFVVLYFVLALLQPQRDESQTMRKIACNTCVIIKLEPFWLKAAKISENVKTSSVFHQTTPLTRRLRNFAAVVAGPRVLEGWTNSVKLQGFFCFATQENFWLFFLFSLGCSLEWEMIAIPLLPLMELRLDNLLCSTMHDREGGWKRRKENEQKKIHCHEASEERNEWEETNANDFFLFCASAAPLSPLY